MNFLQKKRLFVVMMLGIAIFSIQSLDAAKRKSPSIPVAEYVADGDVTHARPKRAKAGTDEPKKTEEKDEKPARAPRARAQRGPKRVVRRAPKKKDEKSDEKQDAKKSTKPKKPLLPAFSGPVPAILKVGRDFDPEMVCHQFIDLREEFFNFMDKEKHTCEEDCSCSDDRLIEFYNSMKAKNEENGFGVDSDTMCDYKASVTLLAQISRRLCFLTKSECSTKEKGRIAKMLARCKRFFAITTHADKKDRKRNKFILELDAMLISWQLQKGKGSDEVDDLPSVMPVIEDERKYPELVRVSRHVKERQLGSGVEKLTLDIVSAGSDRMCSSGAFRFQEIYLSGCRDSLAVKLGIPDDSYYRDCSTAALEATFMHEVGHIFYEGQEALQGVSFPTLSLAERSRIEESTADCISAELVGPKGVIEFCANTIHFYQKILSADRAGILTLTPEERTHYRNQSVRTGMPTRSNAKDSHPSCADRIECVKQHMAAVAADPTKSVLPIEPRKTRRVARKACP